MPKANVVEKAIQRLRGSTFPAASSRIEKFLTQKATLSAKKKALEDELNVVNARLLRAVKAEGEPGEDGKIKLESDDAIVQLIAAKTSRIDGKTLAALGVDRKIITKATVETAYEYVGVYPKDGKKAK